jgi:hypothetical protein
MGTSSEQIAQKLERELKEEYRDAFRKDGSAGVLRVFQSHALYDGCDADPPPTLDEWIAAGGIDMLDRWPWEDKLCAAALAAYAKNSSRAS